MRKLRNKMANALRGTVVSISQSRVAACRVVELAPRKE